jgi:hypothetical protein
MPARPPNMRLAHFNGFLAGAKDQRSIGAHNPYARGAAQHRFWQRAHDAAAAGAIPGR